MTRAVQIAELGDQNTFSIDSDSDRVGIGSTQPSVTLDVTGDGNVSGTLTATSFSGDGIGLTGVAATDNIITGTAATFTNNVNISGITTVGVLTATQVNVTGVTTGVTATFTGDVSVRNLTGVAATFTGVLTYEDVTNVDSVGVVTARSGIEFGASGVGGTITATGQAEFAGVCTASSFSGSTASFSGNVSIADSIIHTGDTDTSIRFPAANTFTVETGGSERLRVDSSGLVGVNTDSPGRQLTVSGKDSEGVIQITNNTSGGTGGNGFELIHFTSGETQLLNRENGAMRFDTNNTERLRITSDGEVRVGSAFSVGQAGVCTASSFNDSIGDVRSIPLKTESSSSSYTLIASDAGKTIHVHTTTTTVVVPNSVFSAGDAVSIVNGDGSNTPTIQQGSGFSLRNTGDGSTGNRTLGVFGMATIYFTGAGVGYISGSGMT